MNMIVIKKQSSKLKDMSVEMPNAPYSKRYASAGTLYKHPLQSYRNIVYTF